VSRENYKKKHKKTASYIARFSLCIEYHNSYRAVCRNGCTT